MSVFLWLRILFSRGVQILEALRYLLVAQIEGCPAAGEGFGCLLVEKRFNEIVLDGGARQYAD